MKYMDENSIMKDLKGELYNAYGSSIKTFLLLKPSDPEKFEIMNGKLTEQSEIFKKLLSELLNGILSEHVFGHKIRTSFFGSGKVPLSGFPEMVKSVIESVQQWGMDGNPPVPTSLLKTARMQTANEMLENQLFVARRSILEASCDVLFEDLSDDKLGQILRDQAVSLERAMQEHVLGFQVDEIKGQVVILETRVREDRPELEMKKQIKKARNWAIAQVDKWLEKIEKPSADFEDTNAQLLTISETLRAVARDTVKKFQNELYFVENPQKLDVAVKTVAQAYTTAATDVIKKTIKDFSDEETKLAAENEKLKGKIRATPHSEAIDKALDAHEKDGVMDVKIKADELGSLVSGIAEQGLAFATLGLQTALSLSDEVASAAGSTAGATVGVVSTASKVLKFGAGIAGIGAVVTSVFTSVYGIVKFFEHKTADRDFALEIDRRERVANEREQQRRDKELAAAGKTVEKWMEIMDENAERMKRLRHWSNVGCPRQISIMEHMVIMAGEGTLFDEYSRGSSVDASFEKININDY